MKRDADGDEDQPAEKKASKFKLMPCPRPKPKLPMEIPKVPPLRDRRGPLSEPEPVPPPESVVVKIGSPSLTIGADIETHDWKKIPGTKGGSGPHGFYTRKDADLALYSY